MPNLHPISCGCRACRGPTSPMPLPTDRAWRSRHSVLLVAIGIAVAALLEAFS